MSQEPWGRDQLMVMAAVRYCIGRMSYIVSDCVEWILTNWDNFNEGTKRTIRMDLEDAFKRDDERIVEYSSFTALGSPCDREEWEKVRALWLKPKEE